MIDLAGHSQNNRLKMFASKPAPVQITWLGFPGSTGLKTIDYKISDSMTTPDNIQEYFSEKIWNLNRFYLCYSPPKVIPEVNDLPFFKNSYITFGSFNRINKITSETINFWSLFSE